MDRWLKHPASAIPSSSMNANLTNTVENKRGLNHLQLQDYYVLYKIYRISVTISILYQQ